MLATCFITSGAKYVGNLPSREGVHDLTVGVQTLCSEIVSVEVGVIIIQDGKNLIFVVVRALKI
jgi:uncharacterized protein involved in response to NO